MPKFLLLYREGQPDHEPSPAEMEAVMKDWTDWIGEGHQQGILLDIGDALQPQGGCVYRADGVKSDGPYIENKEICGGYSVAQADSIDAIEDYVRRCPSCTSGGSVEVRPMTGVGETMG